MHRVFPASHCISLAPVPCLKQATGHGGYAVVLPGLCGGVWLCAVSRLACVVASHAVLTWRAGEGGGLILPALAKSAPTLPSPPRHPGTARCAACGYADRNAGCSFCPRIPVQAYTGSHGQGVSRSDNLCSQRAEDGSPLERAQSEATLLRTAHHEVTPPKRAERTNDTPDRQSAARRVCCHPYLYQCATGGCSHGCSACHNKGGGG